MVSFFVFLVSACSKNPKPIAFGIDNCDHCKMNISDTRFGAELITKKGRIYKFDDVYCLKHFLKEEVVTTDQVHALWLVDFAETEKLIPTETARLLHNPELRSPMGSNAAAFGNKEELNHYLKEYSGTVLLWQEYIDLK